MGLRVIGFLFTIKPSEYENECDSNWYADHGDADEGTRHSMPLVKARELHVFLKTSQESPVDFTVRLIMYP